MKTIEIFCNYGVLAAEKRKIYTYGEQHPTATCYDKMVVNIPENYEMFYNASNNLMVETPWGWIYEINELLSDLNGHPVVKAIDKNGKTVTCYLYTEEELKEKKKKMEQQEVIGVLHCEGQNS